jgi:hypothetical protein
MHRKMLPVETYKITAGIKGGIAGGIAMSVPAMLFGLIKYHSIWYAINLLAAGGFVSWAGRATRSCGVSSARVSGGARDPRRPLAAGRTALWRDASYVPEMADSYRGFVAPFLWTGLVYSVLGIVSPILDQRIDWLWFTISQCAFGLVAGFVVNLDVKVRTPQFQALPFAVRAGLHGDLASDPRRKTTPMSAASSLCLGLCLLSVSDVLAVMRLGIRRQALKFRVRIK